MNLRLLLLTSVLLGSSTITSAQRIAAQRSAAQRIAAQRIAAQRSAAQRSAAQRSAAQRSAAQRSAAQPSLSVDRTIPGIYTNLGYSADGRLYYQKPDGTRLYAQPPRAPYTLTQMTGQATGTANGLAFDFGAGFDGTLYYGFIDYGDSRHPQPVYFKRTVRIRDGKAGIDLMGLRGRYDMIGWEAAGRGGLGYRVAAPDGTLLYDGRVAFSRAADGAFRVENTLAAGPTVNILKPDGATIAFTTSQPTRATVTVGGRTFQDEALTTRHEIAVTGLPPATEHEYTVRFDGQERVHTFRTAPAPGSRQPFTFAYASDSRNGQGGGERNLYGANYYIVRKIAALSNQQDARFLQFTGDMVNGYLLDTAEMHLQYANWQRAVEPFAHYWPVYAGMGNHEAMMHVFVDSASGEVHTIDRFPFETESAEATYQAMFVNPTNGPESEDGGPLDPNPDRTDFPSYRESVFYYTYDNVAMIVMNSNYAYSPSASREIGGNIHAYIMDQQLEWVRQTVRQLERDPNIDHIFITEHTPFFPNGGHVDDDMWYGGSNDPRPTVAGRRAKYGIIERRDQLLDLLVNDSQKLRAILTGDEHNYARTEIGPDTEIYPEDYRPKKIKLRRTIWQINNGSAGAPYYAQEQTPWTPKVQGFTTQYALVLFRVDGPRVVVEVLNPDTLEKVDEMILAE